MAVHVFSSHIVTQESSDDRGCLQVAGWNFYLPTLLPNYTPWLTQHSELKQRVTDMSLTSMQTQT